MMHFCSDGGRQVIRREAGLHCIACYLFMFGFWKAPATSSIRWTFFLFFVFLDSHYVDGPVIKYPFPISATTSL